MNLKRVQLSSDQKDALELVSGQEILLKNTFQLSHDGIGKLMDQAKENALEYLKRKRLGHSLNIYEENNLHKALLEIAEGVGMAEFPQRIECYDISHLQGKFVYGSMVVFLNGKPAKKFYRLFKTHEKNNDYENLADIIRRRLERFFTHSLEAESSWKLPELMVIDGGKGQLGAVRSVLDEYRGRPGYEQLKNITLCALAKQEELVFVSDREDPIRFSGLSKFLLQRLRDETHRFGITNNRKARLKTAHKTELSDIPGLGSVTAKKLLTEFGSVANVSTQLVENYAYVEEFVGKSIASKLAKYFGIQK